MKKLEDMELMEKVNELQALVAKAELEVEYKIQVAWPKGEDSIPFLKQEIENARFLFGPNGRIAQLDYDVKAAAYAEWQVKLDTYLKLFPEYAQNDVYTESTSRGL